MAYVKIKLIFNGDYYDAEVDPERNPVVLAESLAKELTLPDGKYRIALIDSSSIRAGATVELIALSPSNPVRNVKKRQ